jgi:Ubiquitin carboxyl-terminal hydrolase
MTASSVANTSRTRSIPSHAYIPPYGSVDPSLYASTWSQKTHQAGITRMLCDPQDHLVSVSSTGLRMHTLGGCQVAELPWLGLWSMCPHVHSGDHLTHVTVGGLEANACKAHCVDLHQGMRVVSSTLVERGDCNVTITCLSMNHGCLVAGCSDGSVRLLDGQRMRHGVAACVASHPGGVVSCGVSPDGRLIATTGYSSRATPTNNHTSLYSFPDPTVLIYDVRYLGRGGIPHSFVGMNGGPRHLEFMPQVENQAANRLIVASGQNGGGMQIVTPFQEESGSPDNFIIPPLEQGDAVSALHVYEDKMALGTKKGKVIQYQLEGYRPNVVLPVSSDGLYTPNQSHKTNAASVADNAQGTSRSEKLPLVVPSYHPKPPALSIDASLLLRKDLNIRNGSTDRLRSLFSLYTLNREPTVSKLSSQDDKESTYSFGHLEQQPIVPHSRYNLAAGLQAKLSSEADHMQSVPVSDLGLDVLDDHRPEYIASRYSQRKKELLSNPNKFVYCDKPFHAVYKAPATTAGKNAGRHGTCKEQHDQSNTRELLIIPKRYRLTVRPLQKGAAGFNHAEYNSTGYIPGWDYPPTMPNAFVPAVLMILYFIPELHPYLQDIHLGEKAKEMSLLSELSLLFHRITSLSQFAMVYPAQHGTASVARLEAWAPLSFIACLLSMPEADQLQILETSPAAVDSPRRPEAFYRFLLYHLDKEICKAIDEKPIEMLAGTCFVSVNKHETSDSLRSCSTTKALTTELSYERFLVPEADCERKTKSMTSMFCDVLQHTLCRATCLRAWNQKANSYENIVQHRIVTSLPSLLSLSCVCAGRKEEEELSIWRQRDFLPDMIEIEMQESGNVIVRQLSDATPGAKSEWKEANGSVNISPQIQELVAKERGTCEAKVLRYRLEAIVLHVRDDLDRNHQELATGTSADNLSHLNLVVRVPTSYKRESVRRQIEDLQKFINSSSNNEPSTFGMTLAGYRVDAALLERRLGMAERKLSDIEACASDSEWVLINGYTVSSITAEDARDFCPRYKEPCIGELFMIMCRCGCRCVLWSLSILLVESHTADAVSLVSRCRFGDLTRVCTARDYTDTIT